MSETPYTHAIVPFIWDSAIETAVDRFAKEMSEDPKRRLLIRALLQEAWPKMLKAAVAPNRANVARPAHYGASA